MTNCRPMQPNSCAWAQMLHKYEEDTITQYLDTAHCLYTLCAAVTFGLFTPKLGNV